MTPLEKDLMANNKALFMKHAPEFKSIFGTNLKPYFDMITGFDVIRFDEELIKPGKKESTEDKVRKVYGERAVQLCRELLGPLRKE